MTCEALMVVNKRLQPSQLWSNVDWYVGTSML